jgi:uncharacterized membrane protein YdjX (TVP38/TMEM64 family)
MAMDHTPESPDLTSPPGGSPPVSESITAWVGGHLGAGAQMADRNEYLFFLTLSVLFLLGLLATVGYLLLGPLWARMYPILTNKDKVCGLLKTTGSWGPLIYILILALQVLVMIWPMPVEVAGGFLFGLPWGLLYSTAGLALGSTLAFLLGRGLERQFVVKVVPPEKLQRFRLFMKRQGTLAAFLIFLIPAVPKDAVCYVLGLTRMSLKFFVVAVIIARFPNTLLYTLEGAQAYKGNYLMTLGLLACYLGLAMLMYRHRERLYQWISRWHLE